MRPGNPARPAWVNSATPVHCRFVVASISRSVLPGRRFVLVTFPVTSAQDSFQLYFDSATDEGIADALEKVIVRFCPEQIFVEDNRHAPAYRPGPACQELLYRYGVRLEGWFT